MYLLGLKVLLVCWEISIVVFFGMVAWTVFWAERGAINQHYADEYGKKYSALSMVKDLICYDRSRSVLFSAMFGLAGFIITDIVFFPRL